MSGFQIPGLGFAKPDEKLPPLPTDHSMNTETTTTTATISQEDVEIKDAEPAAPAAPAQDTNISNQADLNVSAAQEPSAGDAMAVDQPDTEPSLTDALEAALGGLDAPPQAQPAASPAQPQQDQETAPAPLQPDTSANPEWEVDSSPYESSSESSSDSSDSDSDNEGYELLGVEETARLLMEAEGGSDDEGGKNGKGSGPGHMRTKNELPEEIIPKPDVVVTPEMRIQELGAVEHVVDNICLVKAFTPGEYQVLDTGSVLCTEGRAVIGAVAEVIGQVLQPMYTVYFTSADDIRELGLEVGTRVFYPVDHANLVFTEPLKGVRGSDASNLHDEEVAADEMEFSDDEKEAEYKKSLKQKKKDKWKKNNDSKKEPHPLRQEASADAALNYDEDDGPYKPLTRPPGFGEGPVSVEQEPSRATHAKRGDFKSRGRGGRGRGGRGGGGSGPRDGYSLPPQGQAQQQQQQQPSQPQWNAAQAPAPSAPNFGFQMPGWPQQPQAGAAVPPPPPPPGWPGSAQAQGQGQPNQPYINPNFFAALMSHMQQQQQQGGQPQNQWGQQPPPSQ